LKKGLLTLSGVILENLTVKQFQDMQAASAKTGARATERGSDPQTDTSLRRFKRGTILRYGFEIYNAKLNASQRPQLATQIRIFRDGNLLFEGKQLPIDTTGQTDMQRIAGHGALNLGAEMLPGDYVMQIITIDNLAKEKRKLATQFVQFEIID
jgi:hypothetical protein